MSSLTRHQLLAECAGIRCIAHIDLDCFYCQVEHKRLSIPSSVPLAVQQWQGLIAVNYAARAAGVKRHETVQEALKKCPDLRLVHVATYSESQVDPDYYPDPSPQTHKVSLEPYRRASAEIFKIISKFSNKYQKASVDEGYLDLTQDVIDTIVDSPPTAITFDDWEGTFWIGEKVETTWANYALYLTAKKVKLIRDCIFKELSFTCSAGIAHNKTLAKLCSSRNKPNKQTLIPLESVSLFLDPLPISSIPFLGGKLGSKVMECLNVTTCGELKSIPLERLQEYFDPQTSHWLHKVSRGICDKEVIERSQSKSMMAAKSLRPTVTHIVEAINWLSMLCNELWIRVRDDADLNQRWPSTLTLTIQRPGEESSQSCPFPSKTSLKASPEALITKAKTLLSVPCSRLMVQCSGFHKLASNSIETWFQKGSHVDGVSKKKLIIDEILTAKKARLDTNIAELPKPKKETWPLINESKPASDAKTNQSISLDLPRKIIQASKERKSPANGIKKKESSNSNSSQSKISFFMNVAESKSYSQLHSTPIPNLSSATSQSNTAKNPEIPQKPSPSDSMQLQHCSECKEMFPLVGMQEHMDWHFAMKLQERG